MRKCECHLGGLNDERTNIAICGKSARFQVYADGGDAGIDVCGDAAHLARAIKERAKKIGRIIGGEVHVKTLEAISPPRRYKPEPEALLCFDCITHGAKVQENKYAIGCVCPKCKNPAFRLYVREA